MGHLWMGLALLLMGSGATVDGDVWVLGPGAEPSVKRLAAEVGRAADMAVGAITIEAEEVRITLHGADQAAHELVVRKGSSTAPKIFNPTTLAAVQRIVSSQSLPWVRAGVRARPKTPPSFEIDATVAATLAAARARSRALRRGEVDPGPVSGLPPCPGCEAVRSGEPVHLLRRHPEEPRVWVQAARDAWRRGRHHEALAKLDVATRHERVDQDALRMWSRLHSSAVTGLEPPSSAVFEEDVPLLLRWAPVALGLAAAAWLVALVVGAGGPWALVGALVVLLGWFAGQGAGYDGSGVASPPPLHEALEAPLVGGPCHAAPALWAPQGRAVLARCGEAQTRFVIRPREGAPAGSSPWMTEHHELLVEGHVDHPEVRGAATTLLSALETAEAAGWRVQRRPPDPPGGVVPVPDTIDAHELRYATSLVVVGALMALLLIALMGRWTWRALAIDPLLRRAVIGMAALILVAHLVLPDRMVMVYTGYDLAARLFGFGDLPRYGAGVVALYGGLGELFGAHHSVIIAANRVMGALMSVSLLSLVVSVVGARRVGVLIAMSLVLGLPIVWRDQMSEAIMTGSASLLITGLAAVVMGVLHEEARPLSWLGLAPLAAASVCRPEAPGAIACVLLGLLLVRRGRGDALALAAIMALALVPQLGWFDAVIAREVAADGIIAPSTALSERLSDVLVRRNLFVFGPWLSSFSLVWVVVACWRGGRHRWLCLSLVAAAVAWIGASSVDLPDVSIPRVHLPALFLVLPVMAVGAQRLSNRPHLQGSIVGLVALHAALSIGPVYEPSNADHEERLIRLAQAHAPAPGGCVTTIHFEDPPDVGHTQRHFPVYLFEGRTFSGLEAFDQVWPTCGGRAIVILGARCYMDYREPGEPVVPGAGVVEACAAFRDRYQLRPIEEVTITNRTRWTFEMYPDTPTLELGLYEVLARNIEVESEDSMEKPNERQ